MLESHVFQRVIGIVLIVSIIAEQEESFLLEKSQDFMERQHLLGLRKSLPIAVHVLSMHQRKQLVDVYYAGFMILINVDLGTALLCSMTNVRRSSMLAV